jgi:hypothetical protein
VDDATVVMTDEGGAMKIGSEYGQHQGAGEYVRGGAHTNTIEGYFSILKRGIIGYAPPCQPATFEAVPR